MTGIHHAESCNVLVFSLFTSAYSTKGIALGCFSSNNKIQEKPQTASNFWSQLALHSTLLEQELF